MTNETTEIAKREPTPVHRPFEPRDQTEAWDMACKLAKSDLVPKDFRGKAENTFLALLRGREKGYSPIQSLELQYVVGGRIADMAQGVVGRIISCPICEYFRPVPNEDPKDDVLIATWETLRKGHPEPVRASFTIVEAKRQGLVGKDNWRKSPEDMLMWRAATRLGRRVYPDVVGAMYTPDELEHLEPAPPLRMVRVDQAPKQEPSRPEPKVLEATAPPPAVEVVVEPEAVKTEMRASEGEPEEKDTLEELEVY